MCLIYCKRKKKGICRSYEWNHMTSKTNAFHEFGLGSGTIRHWPECGHERPVSNCGLLFIIYSLITPWLVRHSNSNMFMLKKKPNRLDWITNKSKCFVVGLWHKADYFVMNAGKNRCCNHSSGKLASNHPWYVQLLWSECEKNIQLNGC